VLASAISAASHEDAGMTAKPPVKKPIVFGDLARLGPLLPEDLSLPQEVLDEFEKSIERTARQLKLPRVRRRTRRSEA